MKEDVISSDLLIRKISGETTVEENVVFEAWINESVEHKMFFENLERVVNHERVDIKAKEVIQSYWKFESRIMETRRNRFRKVFVQVGVAASVLILLSIGLNLFLDKDNVLVFEEKINPGGAYAILEMDGGNVYRLDESYFVINENGNRIIVDSNKLSFAQVKKTEGVDDVKYNKITIPRGGEYCVELEDETLVWLNSETYIRFPESFNDVREVYLEGEAYFEVKKDDRPFTVITKHESVTVLGTSFGVRCYDDETEVLTTLVSGRVSVEISEIAYNTVLVPGMNLTYDVRTGDIESKIVDTEEYVGWKNNKYVFNQKNLESILRTLSRWYDFDVEFVDEGTKDILFSGDLKRFDDFNYILYLIEQTSDVKFSVEQKCVKVLK